MSRLDAPLGDETAPSGISTPDTAPSPQNAVQSFNPDHIHDATWKDDE